MKNVVIIVIIILGGLVVFNYLTTGEIKVIPGAKKLSPEEQQVADLRSEYEDARKQYMQAGRGSAVSGMDTTAEAEGALRIVDRIEQQTSKLRSSLSSDQAKAEADRLLKEIKAFKSGL